MPPLTLLGGSTGRIDGILALPKLTAFGKPAYPSPFDKAAALFRSLILDHPFVDGNKRMAVAATLVFLWQNDEVVCATDRGLVTRALTVAEGMSDWRKLSRWFMLRSRSIDAIKQAIEDGTLEDLVAGLPGRASLANRVLLDAAVTMMTQA